MNKKLFSLLLVLVLAVGCLAGCGSNDSSSSDSEDKVAMITDYGDITDQSFNQTTYEACKAFCESNSVKFNYYKPTGDSKEARVASVEQAIDEGYNIIVMPGYAFGGTIVDVSKQYPDIKFVGLDVAAGDILEAGVAAAGKKYDYNPDNWKVEDYCHMDNVYCAIYQEELSGYMAGYAAVKLGYEKLGFLGGMAVPAVTRYGYGFVQGADAAAAEANKKVEVKYAYGNQFYGDADITSAMDTWYSAGTEAVFACGGGIFSSAAEAAAKVKGKVIGVDVDQSATIDGTYGKGMTITSAMKGLAPTVQTTLNDIIKNGKWADYAGKINTLGLVSENPEENYCQLPMNTTQWADGFTKDNYTELVKKMYKGEIKVSNDISAMPKTKSVKVIDQGNIK